MKRKELIRLIRMDQARYSSNMNICRLYMANIGFRIVYRYRLVNYFRNRSRSNKLFGIPYIFERLLYHRTCIKCGCDIPSHVKIGGGWKIIHTWGIVINSKTIIGENFTVLSGTVIGANHTGVPHIGNNVYCGAHSLIIGGVSIGDSCEIGAGAIVTHDVPNYAVVIGDSAHVNRIKLPNE